MADKDDDKEKGETEPLTEAQRLELIEKKMGTSRTIMMIVALLLVMVISVAVTAFIVFVGKSSNKDESELLAQIAALQAEVASMSARFEEQDARIEEAGIMVANNVSKQLKTTGNNVLISLMVEQEGSNQLFLDSARSSIYDLAHMVPGSRTWLEVYSEQIDTAIAHSKTRQAKLKTLESSSASSSAPPSVIEEDDGFGDF